MANTYNITVPTSKYEVGGEEKTRRTNIGKLVEKSDGGFFIAFDDMVHNYLKLILGSSWNGMASVFEMKQRENKKDNLPSVDDDMPF